MKKFLCIMLAISMLLTTFSFVVFADEEQTEAAEEKERLEVTEDAPFYQAVKVLAALGIMQGKSEDDFAAEDFLTRAEMSAIAIRFIGLDGTGKVGVADSGYTDVDDEHWAKYYIDMATALEMLNGNGDGTFDPEGELTAEQAIKILVCALGYEPKAATRGNYPTGYTSVAAELGMLTGLDFPMGYGVPIVRWQVAMLVFNALDAELMDVMVYGKENHSIVKNETNAFAEYHNVEKRYGTIISAHESSLKNDVLYLNEINIDGVDYVTNLNMNAYVGYEVEFYCTIVTGSEKSEIIAFFTRTGRSKEIVVNFDDIEQIYVNENFIIDVKYYNEGESKLKSVSLANPIIMYNGKAESFDNATDAQNFIDGHTVQGQIKALLNSKNGYDDILFIDNYDAYVVAGVNSESKKITYNIYSVGKIDNGTLDLSTETDKERKVFVYGEDGKEIEFSDLVAGDVIMVYESSDKSIYKVYQSKKQVTGKITRIDKIDGTTPDGWPPPKPEPEPQPQPYWEPISSFNMDGFTHISTRWWVDRNEMTVDGHTYYIDAYGEGNFLGNDTGIKRLSDLDTAIYGPITTDKPEEVGEYAYLLHRGYRNGPDKWGWPSPGISIRPTFVFDTSNLAIGDKVKITAWVYSDDIMHMEGGGTVPTEVNDDTAPSHIRMWLSHHNDRGGTLYQSAAPDETAKADEQIQTDIPSNEWVEVSFVYTFDEANSEITSIRIDNGSAKAINYPLNFFFGGMKVEKYIDPNAGKPVLPDPRPEILLDPTDYEIYIDGKMYRPVTSFPSSLLEMGVTTTLLLDTNGKIAGYLPDQKKAGYGLLMDVGVIGGAFGSTLKVRIFDTDRVIREYETLEEIKAFNGTDVVKMPVESLVTDEPADPMTDWHLWSTNNASNFECVDRTWLTDSARSKAASRKIVYYETNSKGQIHTILVPSMPEDHPDCKISMEKDFEYNKGNENQGILYQSYWARFLTNVNLMQEREPVYRYGKQIPKYYVWPNEYGEEDYDLNNGELWKDNLVDGKNWQHAQLYRYPGSETIDFMVINSRAIVENAELRFSSEEAKLLMVDNIEETEDGYILNAYTLNLKVLASAKVSYKVKKNLRVMENIWTTKPTSDGVRLTWNNIMDYVGTLPYNVAYESDAMGNQDTPYVKPGVVEKGDLIRVSLDADKNEISYFEVIRRLSTGLATSFTRGNIESITNIYTTDSGYVNGEIVDIDYKLGIIKVKGYFWPGVDLPISSDVDKKYMQAANASKNYIHEITLIVPSFEGLVLYDVEREMYREAEFSDYEIGDMIYIEGPVGGYPRGMMLFKNSKGKIK